MSRYSLSKIWILVIVAMFIVGGILAWQYLGVLKEKIKRCEEIQSLTNQVKCWTDLAKETRDESYCEKISNKEPGSKGNCYVKLAILKNDPFLCEKLEIESYSESAYSPYVSRCREYFREYFFEKECADYKTYQNEQYGFQVKYPSNGSVKELSKFPGGGSFEFEIENGIIMVFAEKNPKGAKTLEKLIEQREKEFYIDSYPTYRIGRHYELINIYEKTALRWDSYTLFFEGGHYFFVIYPAPDKPLGDIYLEKKIYELFVTGFKFIEDSKYIDILTGEIKISEEEIAKRQKSVDEGHTAELWRTTPPDVVKNEGSPYGFVKADFKTLKEIYQTEGLIKYQIIHDEKAYIITVIQPFLGRGKIWTISEIEAWKTYRNEEYGYELKYPKEWKVYEITGADFVSIIGKNWISGDEPGLFRHPIEKERIDILVRKLTPDVQKEVDEMLTKSLTKKEIKMGTEGYQGIEAEGFSPFLRGEGYDIDFRVIYLKHNLFLYQISVLKDDPAMLLFDQILSTFQFLE